MFHCICAMEKIIRACKLLCTLTTKYLRRIQILGNHFFYLYIAIYLIDFTRWYHLVSWICQVSNYFIIIFLNNVLLPAQIESTVICISQYQTFFWLCLVTIILYSMVLLFVVSIIYLMIIMEQSEWRAQMMPRVKCVKKWWCFLRVKVTIQKPEMKNLSALLGCLVSCGGGLWEKWKKGYTHCFATFFMFS